MQWNKGGITMTMLELHEFANLCVRYTKAKQMSLPVNVGDIKPMYVQEVIAFMNRKENNNEQ